MIFMLCQSCGKKQATFHYTSNENGNITEMHLCSECAKKSGLVEDSYKIFNPLSGFSDSFFSDSEGMLGGLLGGMFANPSAKTVQESAVCPFCGMRLREFMNTGKAGCGKCYATFKESLEPTVKKLHGNTKHTGKFPIGREKHRTIQDKKAELEALMKKAIEEQAYEKAAEYRDKIKELEKSESDGSKDDSKGA